MKHALPILLILLPLGAAEYRAPAGNLPAIRRPGAAGIIPGGRIIAPLGLQYITGPGTWGLAVSPNGKYIVTADGGPRIFSITVIERAKDRYLTPRHLEAKHKGEDPEDEGAWRSVFMGLAFDGNRTLYAAEGNSGRIRYMSVDDTGAKDLIPLNDGHYKDSYPGDLAYDSRRELLVAVDQANFRLVLINAKKNKVISSVRVGRLPFAVALSEDGKRGYVTDLGMFEYKPIPGADKNEIKDTGLPFPAFGFPSPEAEKGAARQRASGTVDVPGLGSPNAPESNSLCVVNLENPEAPKVEAFIPTGKRFGAGTSGGSSPSGVLAAAGRVFVSNGHNDSITVINPATLKVEREIELRIPGLEDLRGILPMGMAFYPSKGWLLVAEAGINAVGVIEASTGKLLGHLPVSWFPTRVAIDGDTVYVANAKGQGTGPNADSQGAFRESFQSETRRGSLSVFTIPSADDLETHTRRVMDANGFRPSRMTPQGIPPALKYVVLIVKENRTFDEVFGDVDTAANGAVNGAPMLARFGRYGVVYAARGQLRSRLSLRNVNVTPNHHEIARRWAMSDNFYADSEVSVDGHHWLVGTYPDALVQSSWMSSYGGQKDFRFPSTAPGRLSFPQSNSSVHPEELLEAGALWHHLDRFNIPFRNFGEGFELAGVDEGPGLKPTGARYLTNVPMPEPLYRNTSRQYPQFNMNIPDQYRADQFISEVQDRYVKGGQPFPRFIYIHLPNDHITKPRPGDGYPFEASYVADNDFALGRILQFLSNTPWWKQMAVFVTEDDSQGGVDHVDSHRTVLMVASPFAKQNYVSHVHSSFPGLLKTIFRVLGLPPLNLFDAVASDLADCFTYEPDFDTYRLQTVPPELFDPNKAKEATDPGPPVRMDDPAVLREQHRE